MLKGKAEQYYYMKRLDILIRRDSYLRRLNIGLNISFDTYNSHTNHLYTSFGLITMVSDYGSVYSSILVKSLRRLLDKNGVLETFNAREHYIDILKSGTYVWYLDKLKQAHSEARGKLIEEFDNYLGEYFPKYFTK